MRYKLTLLQAPHHYLRQIVSILSYLILLVTDPLYLVCMEKTFILKMKGSSKKEGIETYESVDDKSHS